MTDPLDHFDHPLRAIYVYIPSNYRLGRVERAEAGTLKRTLERAFRLPAFKGWEIHWLDSRALRHPECEVHKQYLATGSDSRPWVWVIHPDRTGLAMRGGWRTLFKASDQAHSQGRHLASDLMTFLNTLESEHAHATNRTRPSDFKCRTLGPH